jgi:hypothetical protein
MKAKKSSSNSQVQSQPVTAAVPSIAAQLQSQRTSNNKRIQNLLRDTSPHEQAVANLWQKHGSHIEALTGTRFELGGEISYIINAVKTAKYPGGFKAYHEDRKIQVPRSSCLRFAALYEDVASLGLSSPVLQSAYAAGIDLLKHVGKIKLAKTRVQSMTGPEFVAFLQEKASRKLRPSNLKVRDFVGDGMAALAKTFGRIEDETDKNNAYLGVALQIVELSEKATGTVLGFDFRRAFKVQSVSDIDSLFDREI